MQKIMEKKSKIRDLLEGTEEWDEENPDEALRNPCNHEVDERELEEERQYRNKL